MTTRMAPICLWCKRFRDREDKPSCEAFPDGIPAKVWTAESDHTGPLPGDRGLRFVADGELPPGRPQR